MFRVVEPGVKDPIRITESAVYLQCDGRNLRAHRYDVRSGRSRDIRTDIMETHDRVRRCNLIFKRVTDLMFKLLTSLKALCRASILEFAVTI